MPTLLTTAKENIRRAKELCALEGGRRAMTTLEKFETICAEIYERWDKDMRSGKLLLALAGELPGYRKDVDEVRAALAAISPHQQTSGEP